MSESEEHGSGARHFTITIGDTVLIEVPVAVLLVVLFGGLMLASLGCLALMFLVRG